MGLEKELKLAYHDGYLIAICLTFICRTTGVSKVGEVE